MELIPMTDFVFEQNKNYLKGNLEFASECLDLITNYANFLKQPLKLGMFIPCDENDVPLEEPKEKPTLQSDGTVFDDYDVIEMEQYQQAKERVLFDGFELVNDELLNKGVLFWVGDFDGKETVENIIPCNIKLTDSAIKQLNL